MIRKILLSLILFSDFLLCANQHQAAAQSINTLNAEFVKYYNAKDWENAAKYGEKVQSKILAKYGKDKRYAISSYNLAVAYKNMGDYSKAQELLIENKNLKKKIYGNAHRSYANTCYTLAEAYYYTGDYLKSEQLNLIALNIRANIYGTSHPKYAVSCHNLGNLYRKTGQYEKAKQYLLTAIKIESENLNNDKANYIKLANSYNSLAVVYAALGNYEPAEQIYTQVKTIYKQIYGNRNPAYANVCNNIGAFYYELGNFEKAEKHYREAQLIYEIKYGKIHPLYATACNNLAALYEAIGNYTKAERLYLEAKDTVEKTQGKQHPDYSSFVNNLAKLYETTNEYKKAKPLFIEAKTLREQTLGKQHPSYSTSCNNLGVLYYKMGDYRKAEQLYIEAKNLREQILGKQHPDYASSCNNLALLYIHTGNYEKALLLVKEANALFSLYSQNSSKFMSEKERERYLKRIVNYNFDIYHSFFLKNSSGQKNLTGIVYDNTLNIKGQLLKSAISMRKSVLQSKDTSLIRIYNEMNALGKELDEKKQFTGNYQYYKIIQIEKRINSLEKELIQKSQNYAKVNALEKTNWKTIRESLNKNEAAIEFIHFRYRSNEKWTDDTLYYALILRKEYKYPKALFLFEQKELQNLMERKKGESEYNYIKSLYDPKSAKAKNLYRLVWEPLQKYLNQTTDIYISLSGQLNRIAFDAIPCNTANLLSDNYKIIYTSSTARVIDSSPLRRTDIKNAALFGGIDYDITPQEMKQAAYSLHRSKHNASAEQRNYQYSLRNFENNTTRNISWQYLPGTLQETESIKEILTKQSVNVKLYKDKQATEEQFKALENEKVSILHISTHGFYFGNDEKSHRARDMIDEDIKFGHSKNPLLRSGFILAGGNNVFRKNEIPGGVQDGVLSSQEISKLNLFGTKLVVLSACQTGLGDIKGHEGVYGLKRSFKMAGVDYLLFSLWEVPDKQTQELMVNFYQNWFSGMEVRDAFKKAQNTLKVKYSDIDGSAFAWAAFVLAK
jgi:CHAT domain-containing protein/Flp pilus assembly protein TadD